MPYTSVSLFSSAGVGDLAFKHLPVEILVSCELLEERHDIFQANFPTTEAITGDIWDVFPKVAEAARRRLGDKELDILFATPPCQGMSKNGRGKLLSEIRNGARPELDLRNRLILPTLKLANALHPNFLVLENVPEMKDTLIIDEDGELINIIDCIRKHLGEDYAGKAEVVEFADYGVPQRRQRLITIFTRHPAAKERLANEGTLIPPQTHSEHPTAKNGFLPWVTVRDTISTLPELDAKTKESAKGTIPYHGVPVLDEDKYFWVSNTPAGRSAFDNQCVQCGCKENPTHKAVRNEEGINRASRDTPLYCVKCNAVLPRPWVREKDGTLRLMKGYTSAYKRMGWDEPASALTTNFAYACSDNKLHPSQHRTLSIKEALKLHTMDVYGFKLERASGDKLKINTIHEIIGESIPPLGLEPVFAEVVGFLSGSYRKPIPAREAQLTLL
jgi:DNA (cytosine-5)-methyltransferase 1